MFFSDSRYLKVKDYTVTDPQGREVKVKRTRPNPNTVGDFRYQVKQGDRLDLLAWRFYRNPKKWWVISDANPTIMYPDELLKPGSFVIIPPNKSS
jgi:nucleoid-associated protein YgaU